MFERVLIAVDDTEIGADLVRAAMAVTHPRRTDITVANVRRVLVGHAVARPVRFAEPVAATPVEDAARTLRQSGYIARGVVRDLSRGGVADELVRIIDELGPDLVVMGSRGLSDLQVLLTASVSYRILAQANCPILLVRDGARIDPPRSLLLAYDDSQHSRRAARVAYDLAKAVGAEIEVVSVDQPLLAWPGPGIMGWPGVVVEPGASSQRRVDEIVAKLREGVVARGFVKMAAADRAAALVQAADECDSDLIVMGTRGLSRIAGAVIGSVSHEVVHLTARQVLLVPGIDRENELT